MARIDHLPAVAEVGNRPAGGVCAHELGGHASAAIAAAAVEESQHWGRTVELAEPAPEAGARDEAAPLLADEGGVDEERGVVRWEAEEDLLDELPHVHPASWIAGCCARVSILNELKAQLG